MTLKAPLNPGHMIPNSMEVHIAPSWWSDFLQLGFYKDQDLAAAWESIEDVYSNGTIKKVKDWDKITLNITTHELTIEKLAILQSWLVEVHSWTVSWEAEEWKAWEWSFEKDLLLKYANASWEAATVDSVKALISWTETTLTADTDYTVWATPFWATYIKLLVKDTDHSTRKLEADAPEKVKITVTYSTTNATAKVMEHKSNSLAKPFVMVLVNEFEYDWEKKTIKTYVDNCQASKSMLKQIADSDNTTVGFPVEITWNIISQEFVGFSMNSSS